MIEGTEAEALTIGQVQDSPPDRHWDPRSEGAGVGSGGVA